MLKLVICGVVCASIAVVNGSNFGVGTWSTNAINKCEEPSHKFKFDFNLMTINETHEGFYGDILLDDDFTDEYGVRLDICMFDEGTCKTFQVIHDDSLFKFFNKYAAKYVAGCFNAAGIDPVEVPVAKGTYKINEFVYSKEITPGMFGSYIIKMFILNNDVEEGCVEAHLDFKKIEEKKEEKKEE